ncbi:fumarylacetoacetate hydrolase family protein [Metabacillus endolithicus]|uniref:Fumarylacetoacetate hydrolase family protein n=1 Tax=Metabacillus endolithicus TaxID=1535204 RepID=A0ABW5C456_9BACI|nr:fumarylacetoacetate hydrolase family protein [Metabacillus endolithicus]UPG62652.1 fumarylacetoacetate hydrolase family protein [Metabacillus endolithicus]
MKIAIFNENLLGIVQGNIIIDVSNAVEWKPSNPGESFQRLIENFDVLKGRIEDAIATSTSFPLSSVKLHSPVPSTKKIWAAPVNYKNHQIEMNKMFNNAPRTIEDLALFLKSPESLSGPTDPIILPFKDRRTDHEAELGYIVGKKAKNVKAEDAKSYIFGYFALLDISIRGNEERTWRKSFDTFTPIGPWIVTADEIEDPNDLKMTLWVNDEIRQDGSTRHLIYDCYKCFEVACNNMTLNAGDIIATGTPEGVGPIEHGDKVKIEIEQIGGFEVDVCHAVEKIEC